MSATRTIRFEGRMITVPADATDEEVVGILEAPPPVVEVEAPDGAIVEFPHDTPRDVMRDAMRRRFGGPQAPLSGSDLDAMVRGQAPGAPAASAKLAAPTAPPREVGWSDRVGDVIAGVLGVQNQGLRGVGRGIGTIAGLPVDAVTLALNATGAPQALTGKPIERPFLGGESNREIVDAVRRAPIAAARAAGADLSYPPNEPQNFAERYAGRVGEEIGAMAVPAGAALGTAARLGREGVRELPAIVRHFVEPATTSPGLFLAKEVAAAGAAGGGAAAANELTRAAGAREGSLAHAAGDLAGALTGLGFYGAVGHFAPKVADIFNAVRGDPNFANQVAKDAAVDTIAESFGLPSARLGSKEPTDVQPIIDAIKRGPRVGETVPGFRESLADRTGSTGLAGLEYSRQATGSPVFAERNRANAGAIDRAIQANAPEGTPGAFRGELEGRRTQMLQGVSSEAAAARARFDEAAGRLQSSMHADARGADIRAPLEDALAAARQAEREAWQGLGAGTADIRPLASAFADVTGGLSRAERMRFVPAEAGIPRSFLPPGEDPGLGSFLERAYNPTDSARRATDAATQNNWGPDLGTPSGYTANGNAVAVGEAETRRAADAWYTLNAVEDGPYSRERVLGFFRPERHAEVEQILRDGEQSATGPGMDLWALWKRDNPDAGRVVDPLVRERNEAVVPLAQRDPFNEPYFNGGRPDVDDVVYGPRPANDAPGRAEPPPPPVETPLSEATGLRSALTDAQRTAASNREHNRARILGRYVDAVDDYFSRNHPDPDAYNLARGVSRDLNDRFTRPQTAIAQTLDRQQGQYRVPDSGVPRRFVQPDEGRVADFDALMREAGTDPRAQGAIRDQILADVEGLRGPDQVDAYVRSHSRVFERFPELRAQVEEATGLRRSADAATARKADMTEQLGTPLQPGTSSIGRYLRYGDENSEKAIRTVLNAPKPAEAMGELLNFAGNRPEAVEGARRTFWDLMEKSARRRGETTASLDGSQPWMPRALKGFLDDPRNAAVAERLYRDNPEHLADLRKIVDAIQGVDVRQRARAPNASGTAQGMSQVLSPETIQSRYYAYQRGQVSGAFLVTSIAAVAARRTVRKAQVDAIARLVDTALTNPEAAALLLRENNPATRAILARRAKGWIGNEAATLMEALDGEDEDPVKAAVMRRAG